MLECGSICHHMVSYGSVVLCTDLWDKEPYRQVCVGIVVTSGSLPGSTLARNARCVGSIRALGTIIPIFISPMTLVAMSMILYKLCTAWLLNLPCVCICKTTTCMYVIVSIKRLTLHLCPWNCICVVISEAKSHIDRWVWVRLPNNDYTLWLVRLPGGPHKICEHFLSDPTRALMVCTNPIYIWPTADPWWYLKGLLLVAGAMRFSLINLNFKSQ